VTSPGESAAIETARTEWGVDKPGTWIAEKIERKIEK
jgi:hypothetical protein